MRISILFLALDAASLARIGSRCANESFYNFIVTLTIHRFFFMSLSIMTMYAAMKTNGLTLQDKPNAGKDWFNLPKTELTPELKRDLQLLRMRSVLDPKRHYKKESKTAQPPEFSQIGTIIEGPTEFFSARITKKDRKRTFVDETLATERLSRRFDAKYRNIQLSKQSGRKAFYKGLKEKRKPKGR